MSQTSSDHAETALVAITNDEKLAVVNGIEAMKIKGKEASVRLEACHHRMQKVEAEEERYKKEQQRAAELAKENPPPEEAKPPPAEKQPVESKEKRGRVPKMIGGTSAVGKRMFQGMVGILTKQKTQNTVSKVAERNKRLLEAEERAEEQQHKVTALSRQLELKALADTKASLTDLIPKYNSHKSVLQETYAEMLIQEETFALTNFLLTQTKPAIYWKPAKQTDSIARIISNKKETIAEEYRTYRKRLDTILAEVRDSPLHTEEVPDIPRSTSLSVVAGKEIVSPHKPSEANIAEESNPESKEEEKPKTDEDEQTDEEHRIKRPKPDTEHDPNDGDNNSNDNTTGNDEKMDE
eukprot:TRINITY_DN32451_c0_g1_i1.p1 TRINITY_DN32451_c0_g1~~TRINITY_DN32451_c0_g1_i1.p1  ORF type:complete len:375 (+),score=116.50 TRINITY_DN32451_c0_g1_i1:70-1125(+)